MEAFGSHLFRLDCWRRKLRILIYWVILIDDQMPLLNLPPLLNLNQREDLIGSNYLHSL